MTSSKSIPPVPDALAAKLRELAGMDTVAGAAVTVVRDGQAIGFWSAGYASLPFRVPVTEHTLFHLGSVGKHITALAVMQLVDAGSVALDAPVGGYVQGCRSPGRSSRCGACSPTPAACRTTAG